MTDQFVHALGLALDPAWRRLPDAQRRSTCADFLATIESAKDVRSHAYSMVGLQPGVDLMLWRLAGSLDALEACSRCSAASDHAI